MSAMDRLSCHSRLHMYDKCYHNKISIWCSKHDSISLSHNLVKCESFPPLHHFPHQCLPSSRHRMPTATHHLNLQTGIFPSPCCPECPYNTTLPPSHTPIWGCSWLVDCTACGRYPRRVRVGSAGGGHSMGSMHSSTSTWLQLIRGASRGRRKMVHSTWQISLSCPGSAWLL